MESKEVFVKAHVRVIKQKVYRFVCKSCNLVVERTCFPSQPLYCDSCRPPKLKIEKPASKSIKSKRRPKTKESVYTSRG